MLFPGYSIPTDRQDLFKSISFKDNDLDKSNVQVFRFTGMFGGLPLTSLLLSCS